MEPSYDVGGDRGEVDRLRLQLEAARVRAGERQQVLAQGDQPTDLLLGRAQGVAEILGRPRPRERELDLGEEQRQRGAQLVARIGDEPPLAVEALVQPVEHGVQRHRQPAQLGRRRDREPLARAARRDRRRPRAHPLHRPQPEPGDEIAEQAREHQGDRAADRQLLLHRLDGMVGFLAFRGEDERLAVDLLARG